MQCVRTIIGISSATYFLLSLSCPCQTSAGWETTGSYPLAERQSNQTRTSHQIDKDLVFLYILGVQNLKHSEATFALFFFFPLSLLVRLILTRGSLLYSCYQM